MRKFYNTLHLIQCFISLHRRKSSLGYRVLFISSFLLFLFSVPFIAPAHAAGANETQITGITATASASIPNQPASNAVDNDVNTYWSSGAVAPQSITLNLGSQKVVSSIELTVAQYPSGQAVTNIYTADASMSFTKVTTFSLVTQSGDVLRYAFPVPPSNVKYIKVETTQSPSWIAWYEVKVFQPAPLNDQQITTGITATASATLSGYPSANVLDGNPVTAWNSGASATQSIILQFNRPHTVTHFELTVAQYPAGNTTQNIYMGSTLSTMTKVVTINQFTNDGDVLPYNLPTQMTNVQFVKIETTQSPSWIAWKDIKIFESSGQQTYVSGDMAWMTSPVFAAGFNLAWGGSLTHLISNGKDMVNRYDTGREIQAAFYDGSQQYQNCLDCAFGWDPVEGGDKYTHGSQTSLLSQTPLGILTHPLEWNPNGKGGGSTTPVVSDADIEKTVSFVPNVPNAFKIHYKITHFGTDNHTMASQELPAVYANSTFNQLVNYSGTQPWTSDTLTSGAVTTSFASRYNPEEWFSLVDNTNYGFAVFVPGSEYYAAAAYFGDPNTVGNPTDYDTVYAQPSVRYTFSAGKALNADVYILVGSPSAARSGVYTIKNTITTPHFSDPLGALDVPQKNQTLHGTISVSGWTFDSVFPQTGVNVYMDNVLSGSTTLGVSRPDIPAAYPHAPADSGYSYSLDTTTLSNGQHTIRVDAISSDGKTATLSAVPVTISN